jgi:DNA-binding NarL/FixJ family response regulator
MSSNELGLLLVDDRPLVRSGLCGMLNQQPGIQVVGQAGDIEQVIRLTGTLRPDAILVDSQAQSICPTVVIQTTQDRCEPPGPPVLVLANDTDFTVSNALAAGAQGVLLKDLTAAAVAAGIRIAAAGYLVLAPSTEQTHLRRELGYAAAGVQDTSVLDRLTTREWDVLRLIAEGMTNAEIATSLSLSDSTAKSHVQHILSKLHLRNRVDAVVFSYEVGIASVGRPRQRFNSKPGPVASAPQPLTARSSGGRRTAGQPTARRGLDQAPYRLSAV